MTEKEENELAKLTKQEVRAKKNLVAILERFNPYEIILENPRFFNIFEREYAYRLLKVRARHQMIREIEKKRRQNNQITICNT